jgi:hypothetical protein
MQGGLEQIDAGMEWEAILMSLTSFNFWESRGKRRRQGDEDESWSCDDQEKPEEDDDLEWTDEEEDW